MVILMGIDLVLTHLVIVKVMMKDEMKSVIDLESVTGLKL